MSNLNSPREKPLMMHLSLAAKALAEPQLHARESFDAEFWQNEQGKSIKADMERVIDGIRKYQLHPFKRGKILKDIIWQDGEAKLFHYPAKAEARARILVIPSMINGPEILDLLPGRSLMEWLSEQDIDSYLFDWGDLTKDPELKTIDLAIKEKLGRALEWLKPKSSLPLTGLGYCMGGLLLAAADQIHRGKFDALCFVATPWDFSTTLEGSFAENLLNWAETGLPQISHIDNMPAQWLQLIFAGVDARQIAQKFSNFSAMEQDSDAARLFVAVEDWVNGGSDLPSGIVRHSVKNWYQDNKPAEKKWSVAGHLVSGRNISAPSFVVVPSRDKIVPPESAKPLASEIANVTLLEAECGHISMMMGKSARQQVWEPMLEWILLQCSDKPRS